MLDAKPTFAEFYELYPRKKSRMDAEKAWGQMLKKGVSAEEIMAGLRRNLPELKRKDPQFVPYPASWLRAGSWEDEPDAPSRANRTLSDAARDLSDMFAGRDDWRLVN